jgi:thymidylate synthase (FAD)
MIKSKHGAMLEHGTVYLITLNANIANKYIINKYSRVKRIGGFNENDEAIITHYITTNLRVIIENDWSEDLKYISEPTEHHVKRITARFTCDRGVSHEIVRHRVMSFAQESTRYCNYSKDKFGCELTFIRPSWYDKTLENKHGGFEKFLEDAQSLYIALLDQGYLPQEARACLPNALKTEIVVTGFESDWEHFFELRTAGAAHPDIRKLALELQEKLNSVNK